jgi:hypothetical protein
MNEYENYLHYKKIINTNDALNGNDNFNSKNEINDFKTNFLATSQSQKGQIITKRVQEWSKSLTAHGFPKLFIAKRLTVKFLWSLALVASISLAIYYIYKELVKYFHYEYESHLETIFERPSIFPAITLCHINSLKSKEAENLVVDIFKADYGIDLNGNHSLTPHELIEKLEDVNLKARLRTFLPEYGDENRRRLGFSLEDTLIECFYNHHSCDHRDFIWTFSLDYGNCYQFNTGFDADGKQTSHVKESFVPGSQNGLKLMFFLGESNNRFSIKWSTGLKVFVHNQSSKASKFDGINVKTATTTYIGLSRRFEKIIPSPYSDCIYFKGID